MADISQGKKSKVLLGTNSGLYPMTNDSYGGGGGGFQLVQDPGEIEVLYPIMVLIYNVCKICLLITRGGGVFF